MHIVWGTSSRTKAAQWNLDAPCSGFEALRARVAALQADTTDDEEAQHEDTRTDNSRGPQAAAPVAGFDDPEGTPLEEFPPTPLPAVAAHQIQHRDLGHYGKRDSDDNSAVPGWPLPADACHGQCSARDQGSVLVRDVMETQTEVYHAESHLIDPVEVESAQPGIDESLQPSTAEWNVSAEKAKRLAALHSASHHGNSDSAARKRIRIEPQQQEDPPITFSPRKGLIDHLRKQAAARADGALGACALRRGAIPVGQPTILAEDCNQGGFSPVSPSTSQHQGGAASSTSSGARAVLDQALYLPPCPNDHVGGRQHHHSALPTAGVRAQDVGTDADDSRNVQLPFTAEMKRAALARVRSLPLPSAKRRRLDKKTKPQFAEYAGTQVHTSHAFGFEKGVFVCWMCGSFCVARPIDLAAECPRVPTRAGADVLNRITAGLTPRPGMKWPAPLAAPPTSIEVYPNPFGGKFRPAFTRERVQ